MECWKTNNGLRGIPTKFSNLLTLRVLRAFVVLFLYAIPAAESAAAVWNRETSVHWSSVPLGEALERLGETQKIGVFLDRRIDPSRLVEFAVSRRPLGPLLDELATSLELGCCRLDSVAYIGPKTAAQALTARKPPTVPVLRRRVPLEIPFLSTPKEILEQLADANGLRFSNLDRLPHDLWPKRSLPSTPLGQLFDLLLVGFDETFELETDGKTLRIVPLPKPEPTSVASETKDEPKTPSPTVPLARRRFTLTIKDQELEGVLRSLADRTDLKLEIDETSLTNKNVTLRERVSYEATNAAVAELLRGVLPQKIKFTIRGETLRIY